MISSTVAGNTASAKGAGIELDHFSGFAALNSTFADERQAKSPEHGLSFVNSYGGMACWTLALAALKVEGVVEGDLRNSLVSKTILLYRKHHGQQPDMLQSQHYCGSVLPRFRCSIRS